MRMSRETEEYEETTEQGTKSQEEQSLYKVTIDARRNFIVELTDQLESRSENRDENDRLDESTASGTTSNELDGHLFARYTVKKSDGTTILLMTGSEVALVRGKRIGDDDVPDLLNFLRKNPNVVEVHLPSNEIHCDGFIDIVDYVVAHEEIVELDVRNNEIGAEGIKHLCESGDKLRLKSLKLKGNKFGVESSRLIALMLSNNRYLRELNVAAVDQTISSLVYFTTVLGNRRDSCNDTLKILNISSPNPGCMYYVDTAHFASLVGAMLKNNKSLSELYLRKYGFSCHDIELMLNEGRFNATLSFLDLSGNNIGDFGVELLSGWLAARPALSGLALARNIVTSTGASALSRGLPLSRIKHLDVSYNRIDDSGISDILNTLKKSPRIQTLKLFGNGIGHDSAKIINRMLLSGVLIQENLDVRPYRVGDAWSCARYSPDD